MFLLLRLRPFRPTLATREKIVFTLKLSLELGSLPILSIPREGVHCHKWQQRRPRQFLLRLFHLPTAYYTAEEVNSKAALSAALVNTAKLTNFAPIILYLS